MFMLKETVCVWNAKNVYIGLRIVNTAMDIRVPYSKEYLLIG
jgi:hypothetical protein